MFECKHCGTIYKREIAFMNHECEPMRRKVELQTMVGQRAFLIYSKWLTSKHGRPPAIETFADSKFYKTFVQIAKFVKAVKIADLDVFIRMAVEADLPPAMWTYDAVYSKYLHYMMSQVSPRDQIKITVKTIIQLADIFECDTSEIFNHISSGELAQILRERKMSPWVLMFSKKFKAFLLNSTVDVQHMFNDLIHPMYWKMRFEKNPTDVSYVKRVVLELGV